MVRERFPDETDVNVESEIAAGALDIARGMDRGKPVSAETRLKAIDFFYKQTEEPLKTTTKIEGSLSVATHEMSDAELARIIQGHDSSDNGGD